MNKYEINFNMKYSHNIMVIAKNKKEAKEKAWIKFQKKIKNKIIVFDILLNNKQDKSNMILLISFCYLIIILIGAYLIYIGING